MKFGRVQFAVLIVAGTFVSQALVARAQNDSIPTPASNTQSNQPQQQQPGSVSMQDSTGGSDANVGLMRDKQFLRKAAEAGIADVELGKLAAERGNTADVKAFGQKMVDDHSTLNQQIATVADGLGLRLPKTMNSAGKAEYDKLKALSGEDFDKEYVTYMSKANHEAFRDYRTEATSATNENVKELIGKAAPMVRDHSMAIDKIGRDEGIVMPGRRPGPPPGGAPPPAPPQ
jgi:putative membrane protein